MLLELAAEAEGTEEQVPSLGDNGASPSGAAIHNSQLSTSGSKRSLPHGSKDESASPAKKARQDGEPAEALLSASLTQNKTICENVPAFQPVGKSTLHRIGLQASSKQQPSLRPTSAPAVEKHSGLKVLTLPQDPMSWFLLC